MSTTNDGGPAFPFDWVGFQPTTGEQVVREQFPGMSLRDYFAAKALQMIVINDVTGRPENFREHYSKGAYEWADAMLKARGQ